VAKNFLRISGKMKKLSFFQIHIVEMARPTMQTFSRDYKKVKKIAEDEIFKLNARMTPQGQTYFRKSC
jgi:hypothetical protein